MDRMITNFFWYCKYENGKNTEANRSLTNTNINQYRVILIKWITKIDSEQNVGSNVHFPAIAFAIVIGSTNIDNPKSSTTEKVYSLV